MTLLTVFRLLASRIKTERSLLGKFTKKSYTFFTSQMRQALPINSYLGKDTNYNDGSLTYHVCRKLQLAYRILCQNCCLLGKTSCNLQLETRQVLF